MAQNLIFSRRADGGVLNAQEVQNRAPAVYAAGHAEGLSPRYGEISTARAVEILDGYGWQPTQAAQKKSRNPEGRAHAEHLLAFANPVQGAFCTDERPEVVLYNSHNGASSLKLFVGFYRFICSNGIVAGDGFEARIKHTARAVEGFESMLIDAVEKIPAMLEFHQKLKARELSPAAAHEVARRAAALRWQELPIIRDEKTRGSFYHAQTVHELQAPRRYDDFGTDAWKVLNRIQEGVIRGGAMVASFTESNPYGVHRKARAVASVSETVRINRGLWDIVAEVAEVEAA